MEDSRRDPPRRSAATWLLLALTCAVTAVPAVSAGRSLLVVTGVLSVSDRQSLESGVGTFGFFGAEGLRIAEGIALLVTLPVAVSCLAVLVGLATWRPWAREGALGVFGLGGALLLVFSLTGLSDDPTAGRAVGLLVALAVLAVAGLSLSPGVRGDFERREIDRQVRERAAATAARRARQQA